MEKACHKCIAFHPLSDEDGECRKKSPSIVSHEGGVSSEFPQVLSADWCMEHEAKPAYDGPAN